MTLYFLYSLLEAELESIVSLFFFKFQNNNTRFAKNLGQVLNNIRQNINISSNIFQNRDIHIL